MKSANKLLGDLNTWLYYRPKDVNAFCARNYLSQQPLDEMIDTDKLIKTYSL